MVPMVKTTAKIALGLGVALGASLAHAEGDPAEGKKVFRRCQACHVVDKEQNRVGPHLVDVVGREVAAVESFNYSDAMVEWGEGKVWDEATLAEYLEAPMQVVKGTKMAFPGLKKASQIEDVIAYMENPGS